MEIPIIRYKGSHCFTCNTETVIAYDTRNKPLPFVTRKTTTTEDIMSHVNNNTLSYMKCTNCGKHYFIDYSLGFARPIEASYIKGELFSK